MTQVSEAQGYRYAVVPDGEDGYAGICVEFPSLSFIAETERAAATGIRTLVGDVLAEMHASGECVPPPLSV